MAPHRGPRLVLAAGVVAGVLNAVVFPATQPEQVALASDLYYAAARAVLDGTGVYATTGFLYPPPVVVAFLPHALLGDPALAYALQTLLNLAALGALAVVLVRVTERLGVTLTRFDRWLVGAYAVAAQPAVTNLVMGQVNPVLALAIAGGAVLLERGRERAGGVAFGLAALVKLFPALLGAWLLRRRAWRAVAAATATGLGCLLVGVALFGPGSLEAWATGQLTGELSVASFPDGPDPTAPYVTVRRQIQWVAPGLAGAGLLAASLLAVAPVVAGVNRAVATLRQRLVALQGTLLAALVAVPLEPFYLVLAAFPLVPLLYRLDAGTPRRLFLAGGLLLSVPVTYSTVATIAGLGVLPPGVAGALRAGARATFGFALPPTYGVWLVLAGCLLVQHRAAGGSR